MIKPCFFINASVTHVCPWDKVQTPAHTSQDVSRSILSQHLHLPSCMLPKQPLLAPLGTVFILTTFSALMYQVISLPGLSMRCPLPSPLLLLLLLLILCQNSFRASSCLSLSSDHPPSPELYPVLGTLSDSCLTLSVDFCPVSFFLY